jgi:hypothetical protein
VGGLEATLLGPFSDLDEAIEEARAVKSRRRGEDNGYHWISIRGEVESIDVGDFSGGEMEV